MCSAARIVGVNRLIVGGCGSYEPGLFPHLSSMTLAGSTHKPPVLGDILLYAEGGHFEHTGHVAIVVDATEQYVRIAEQNMDDIMWPAGTRIRNRRHSQ